MIKGFNNCRAIRFWKSRSEIYVGYAKGYMTVYHVKLEDLQDTINLAPTCIIFVTKIQTTATPMTSTRSKFLRTLKAWLPLEKTNPSE